MSDDGKCYAATPAATLEEHIVNSNVAKSDTEWWAHHEITRLRAELAAVTAERDRMQIMHDEAYIAGMKHGWNCCAAGDEARYKNSIENTRDQIRRARAALEGVTNKEGLGNE